MKPKMERAEYGAEAFAGGTGVLPTRFPRQMGPNCMKYLQEVVDSGLTCNMVQRFEQAFAKELGVKHCIAAPGCTPALAMLAAAFGFDPGDEIIVSPITDYGTIQGLIRENYIPVFADTEPGTVNLSAETIEPCITERTRAVLVVHKTGIICDMDPINVLAEKHGLIVYEDPCQAVFGEYRGRYAGTLSKAAGFSFDAEKTMGSDIGGCIATNDDDLAERIRFIGQSRGAETAPHFGRRHTAPGYGYRMPNCTAAVCLAQLEIIRDQVAHIDRMVRLLTELIAEIPGITPLPIPDYMNVYSCWMFGMSIDPAVFRCTAEAFAQQLAEAGIPGAGQGKYYLMPAACTFLDENARNKVYPYSMPPASKEYRYSADTCPNARDFLENWIRWATFSEKYQPEHCELAARIVREVAEKNRKA
ncbi:MAG: DegT/DnrJ/EryC1/StrS family aminotransferase [Candidatus Latescibacteria bacterium]|nr:DegT/DnrJ/EryC1/StrS family aminotransferase [Candidatus Latescibacterota bacterium]